MQSELRQMWILAKEIQDLSEQVEELESICQRMTASYDPVGSVRGGSVDRGDDKLAALADLRSTYIETKEELARMEEQLMEQCKTLQERDGLMLQYRYVLRLSWLEIRSAMQRQGYEGVTLRTLHRWLRTARLHLERQMEEVAS